MRKIILAGMMLLSAALGGHAEILNWNALSGDYGAATNWNPVQVPTAVDDIYFQVGTATVSNGTRVANRLYLGQAASSSGRLVIKYAEGNLILSGAAYIANGVDSSGTVTLLGPCSLTTGNLQMGVKGTADMYVGLPAVLNCATFYLGVNGPEANPGFNANGTLDLFGTMNASKVLVAGNGGIGHFNLIGGTLHTSGDFDMDNNPQYVQRSATLTVERSSGSFSSRNFYGADESVVLEFIADVDGFTTLNVINSINISGATLNIDLSAYEGDLGVVLINGASLSGTFSTVNITGAGNRDAQIFYDTVNGDIVLIDGDPDPELSLPSVFSDHMILQRETGVPVWGFAYPGTEVTVSFAGQQKTAIAGSDRQWLVQLDAMQASGVSRTLTVSAPGAESIEFADVLVGEVWLCSGQSNMYRPIGGIPDLANSAVEGYEEVLALPENPNIRLFCDDGHPLWTARQWQRANSETLNLFSAVGYFFGKKISDDLNIPVGLILLSRVGTTIQAWTPEEYALLAPVTAVYRALYEANREEIIAYNQAEAPKPELSYDLQVARTFASVGGLYENWMAEQVPFAIRGVLWYQGESNGTWEPTAHYYDDMLQVLADGLRAVWNRPQMPFYFVQLPIWGGTTSEFWPWIRQSMLNASLCITNSGMAVTVDVGDPSNLHPANKKPVGERLALWALNNTYNLPCVYSGPLPSGAASEAGGVRVQFNTYGSTLSLPSGTWIDIEAAGIDGIFYPATASVGTSNALISCSQVTTPVMVRYGWKSTFTPTLFNTNGLPASPFCFIYEGTGWRLGNGDDAF